MVVCLELLVTVVCLEGVFLEFVDYLVVVVVLLHLKHIVQALWLSAILHHYYLHHVPGDLAEILLFSCYSF